MPEKKKQRKIPSQLLFQLTTALLLIVLEISALFPSNITPIERADLAARDFYIRVRGTQPVDERIVIIAIDDFSFNWTGYQWPWPRTYFAELVTTLNGAGAQVIGLDVFLFEEDPEGDAALAAAFAESPASVNVIQKFTDQQGVTSLRLPQTAYRENFDGLGITSILLDDDAIARGLMAETSYLDQTYYNWELETARLYLSAPSISTNTTNSLLLNGSEIPLQGNQFLINYRGPAETYPTYSAAKVVLGDYPPITFKDKIVLILQPGTHPGRRNYRHGGRFAHQPKLFAGGALLGQSITHFAGRYSIPLYRPPTAPKPGN